MIFSQLKTFKFYYHPYEYVISSKRIFDIPGSGKSKKLLVLKVSFFTTKA